jgi:hypothetical protein
MSTQDVSLIKTKTRTIDGLSIRYAESLVAMYLRFY